jgi:uncharacterized protein
MYVVLPLAGVGAGLVGSVAGLASLISYPMLLAIGLPPVTANVTNSVSLVFASAGSVVGSRPELDGQAARLRWLALAAVAGGATGSALLLLAPAETFEFVVPWLIAGASLAILVPRQAPDAERHPRHGWMLAGGVALVGVYGGYFGAAAGIVLLALFLAMTPDSFARGSAAKNVLLGAANLVAACAFALFGPVHWLAVLPLGAGLFIGGRLGPVVIRRSPPAALRGVIAVLGLGLAVHLGWQAYL